MKTVHIELHVFVEDKEKIITVNGVRGLAEGRVPADQAGRKAFLNACNAAAERAWDKLVQMEKVM